MRSHAFACVYDNDNDNDNVQASCAKKEKAIREEKIKQNPRPFEVGEWLVSYQYSAEEGIYKKAAYTLCRQPEFLFLEKTCKLIDDDFDESFDESDALFNEGHLLFGLGFSLRNY